MTVPQRQPARRILCISPKYSPSFGTFEYAYELMGGVRAFMPPQGLLVIAAALPPDWQVRFFDENIAPAAKSDFAWADAVFVSGMHVQRPHIHDICRRAHEAGRVAVLGRPIGLGLSGGISGLRLSACRRIGRCDGRAFPPARGGARAPGATSDPFDIRAPPAEPMAGAGL